MKIIHNEKPPIYERCAEQFGASWDAGSIFTYGDTIYCKFEIPEDYLIHEMVHVKQQMEMGKDAWWDRYFVDDEFRFQQEVMAYSEQFKWVCKRIKGREQIFNKLKQYALQLSSPLYGNLVSFITAMRVIKS